MSVSTRWTVVVLVVLVALGTAFWMELRDEPAPQAGAGQQSSSRDHRDADTPEALAGPRARADLPPCPGPREDKEDAAAPDSGLLGGITLDCAGDGKPVDVASALAGRTVVLNLWAYWCGPCADELPAMAEYQRRVGDDVLVLTVHQDENETAALVRLAELGVRLPTLQDGRRLIAAALKVPNVMPATVVLRPDGSVAGTLPRSFVSADEIAVAVDEKIRSSR
ncbi:membrane protein [Mycolicibacterium setense]|uniref:Membrane protein n=1 Tax=Mycolicibacterium setense TaxID=431269 RepID=A0ABR4YM81_9MYCO|nr:TlpA disulfide reductase family protein [Mycolicibacterium setense]KHO19858.1 membrane protein [Mycolicibacterium setense]